MNKLLQAIGAIGFGAIVGFTIILCVTQIVGDNTLNVSAEMSTSCEQKKPDCQKLIDRIESGGNYEVLSDSLGHYWVEAK